MFSLLFIRKVKEIKESKNNSEKGLEGWGNKGGELEVMGLTLIQKLESLPTKGTSIYIIFMYHYKYHHKKNVKVKRKLFF